MGGFQSNVLRHVEMQSTFETTMNGSDPMPSQNSVTRSCKMAVCFCSLAKRQHAQVGQLVGPGESGEPCAWSSGSSGRVVPVARGSVVPTVLWFLSFSCSPRIAFQSWFRVAFHMGQDTWAHVLSCRGNREARSIPGRHLSLQFEFQDSVLGKGEACRGKRESRSIP